MVEEGLAAAYRRGRVGRRTERASAVVDIGGGNDERGRRRARHDRLCTGRTRRQFLDIDEAIMDRLRRHHGLIIGRADRRTS